MRKLAEVLEPEDIKTKDEDEGKLSEAARSAIEELVKSCMKEDIASRRAEVRKAWEQRCFKNGNQYMWYDETTHCFMQPGASSQELPRFMDVYNIYTPHWRSFVSILSQNPPGVTFVPDDLQVGRDVTAAAYAEKMRHRVDRIVHMKDRQMEAANLFCTDGRTIAWTRLDDEKKLTVTMHGVLESKVPIFIKDMKEWGYAVLSGEYDKWEMKDEFPDFADDIEGIGASTGESNFERYARLNVLGNRKGGYDTDGFKNLVTKHEAWIRPSRYRKAEDEAQKELKSAFPDGFHATLISGKCVDVVAGKIEDGLRVQWPAPGEGQSRPSMLHDLVPIQQAFNDALNMIREHGEYSIPARWVSDTVDSESIAEQISAPGVTHQIAVPSGASINDLVFTEEPLSLPAELVANVDRLLTLAEFTTGDLPSLYGNGTPDQETASGQKMLSDQAKGQLSPAWAGIQWLFAGVYEIGVRLAAESDPEETAVKGASGQDKFDPSAILDGKWGCYPDTDSSFPETMADKRASLQAVLSQVGQVDGGSIVMQPDNLKLVKQYSGLVDLIIPGAEARDKQLEEIEQLLQESPGPDPAQMPQWIQAAQQAQATGQQVPPPPMKSSIDIGQYDFDQPEFDKCKEWLSSRSCREEQRRGNTKGIENVTLHAQQHEARLKQVAQANAPKAEPPKVSLTAAVTDPTAITQLLGEVGVQTTPENIQAADMPEDQNKVADTQLKAASAQHKAVLAAKEAVTPVKTSANTPAPDAGPNNFKEQ